MNLKKLTVLSLAALALSACQQAPEEPGYKREDDAAVYERALGSYEALIKEAKKEKDDNKRFVKYAKAEAALMDSATFMPTTTQGGTYAITRIAPRTVPYSMWGNDDDRLRGLVVAKAEEGERIFIKGT